MSKDRDFTVAYLAAVDHMSVQPGFRAAIETGDLGHDAMEAITGAIKAGITKYAELMARDSRL